MGIDVSLKSELKHMSWKLHELAYTLESGADILKVVESAGNDPEKLVISKKLLRTYLDMNNKDNRKETM